jgi:hypothetical protein
MCTVVTRWSPSEPLRILALRDELTSRAFNDPGFWWPAEPDVVGGQDRVAGGTWCASRVSTGVTALVLNRPQKRNADEGAPSRGVLPLLGVRHGADWPAHLRIDGMASFLLLLATPDRLTAWVFDGTSLAQEDHDPGTQMFTSGGAEDGKADRFLAAFQDADFPEGWRVLVQEPPADDPAALVVRHEQDDLVFATVFGQLIKAQPGSLHIEYSRLPWQAGTWQQAAFT